MVQKEDVVTIAQADIKRYLDEGWWHRITLKGGRAVMQRVNHKLKNATE